MEVMREVEELGENCVIEAKREGSMCVCVCVCVFNCFIIGGVNTRTRCCRDIKYHEELRHRILDLPVSVKQW